MGTLSINQYHDGSHIARDINRFIKAAESAADGVAVFSCCGISLSVRSDSEPACIYREFLRAFNGLGEKDVCPYPKVIEGQDLSVPSSREDVEMVLRHAPPARFVSQGVWNSFVAQNVDNCGYGNDLAEYIERWAMLMQVELMKGKRIEDVAEKTSYEVDFEGVRNIVFPRAVIELSLHWIYGNELRQLRFRAQ